MARKRHIIEDLIARIDLAIESEFYLEASWLIYSNFEDRCDSLLEKTGGIPSTQNAPFLSINKKITFLKSRCNSIPAFGNISGYPDLFDEVYDWKEKRNPLMHDIIGQDISTIKEWKDIEVESRDLAIEGRDLLTRFNAAAMKARVKYLKGIIS